MSFSKEDICTQARSYKMFHSDPVSLETLQELYEIARWAPTANNCCPLRVVFVTSEKGMHELHETAMEGNKAKVATAQAAAILAYDVHFYEQFPTLAPHVPNPAPQAGWTEEEKEKEAIKNAGIQAGFFMAAARGLGLDCGPMAGFYGDKIQQAFFTNSSWRYYFVILLGKGDKTALYPRGGRLSEKVACRFV